MKTRIRRLSILTGAVVATIGLLGAHGPGPAHAATKHSFAYGAGKAARLWLSSEPLSCSIVWDSAVAQQAEPANQVDSVVLPASALSPVNHMIQVSWGGMSGTTKQLLVKFVTNATIGRCDNVVVTLGSPGTFSVPVPAGVVYAVFSATEGTVQPWVST
jgi:hypothetical protein